MYFVLKAFYITQSSITLEDTQAGCYAEPVEMLVTDSRNYVIKMREMIGLSAVQEPILLQSWKQLPVADDELVQ